MGRGQAEGRRPSAVRAERAHAFPHRPARPLRVTAAPLLRVGTGGVLEARDSSSAEVPMLVVFQEKHAEEQTGSHGQEKI